MSAIRTSSVRTLSKFSKQVRHLHMTGPATFPSPLLTSGRPAPAAVKKAQEAIQQRPVVPEGEGAAIPQRHFNTSRSLKAVNDSSTIDFAYLPAFDPDMDVTAANIQVPIIGGWGRGGNAESEVYEVMRPEISTASLGSLISGSSAMQDGSIMNIDFQGMANKVAEAAKRGGMSDEETGIFRTIWNGLLEDVMPNKGQSQSSKSH